MARRIRGGYGTAYSTRGRLMVVDVGNLTRRQAERIVGRWERAVQRLASQDPPSIDQDVRRTVLVDIATGTGRVPTGEAILREMMSRELKAV